MSHDAFLARQPIVNEKHALIGYELLFRASEHATSADMADGYEAGLNVMASTLFEMGTDWLLRGKLAFINMEQRTLMSDFVSLLPPDKIIIELVDSLDPTEEMLQRLGELKEAGFRIALDKYTPSPAMDKLLPFADYVKIDVMELSQDKVLEVMRGLLSQKAQLIAEKVETNQMFEWCKQHGFHYFQGYYFAHPEHLMARVLTPSQGIILQLMEKVRHDADIKEIEALLKNDVALTFKLLRYINSAGFGLSCEVQSIRHAVSILGMQPLYRWLSLLLATAGSHAASPAQARTAVTRGRLCELLGAHNMGRADQENLFITGVFSLLDAMMDTPMEEILDRLVLPESISDALLSRTGLYGPTLALAEACESQDTKKMEELTAALMLTPEDVTKDHLEALAWIEQIGMD